MSRPKKQRKVCAKPKYEAFIPVDVDPKEYVVMTLEEYEVIRLIDHRGLDQIETSEKMQVARSTIQRIYKEAREKLAELIINGKGLRIQGGQYELCERRKRSQDCPDCPAQIKRRHRRRRSGF